MIRTLFRFLLPGAFVSLTLLLGGCAPYGEGPPPPGMFLFGGIAPGPVREGDGRPDNYGQYRSDQAHYDNMQRRDYRDQNRSYQDHQDRGQRYQDQRRGPQNQYAHDQGRQDHRQSRRDQGRHHRDYSGYAQGTGNQGGYRHDQNGQYGQGAYYGGSGRD